MARQVARPGGHEDERERAAAVAGRLQALVDEVRGAPVPDPGPAEELPELVAATDLAALAGLVAGRLRLPPAVAPARAADALAALDEHLGRPEPVVVPLPEPTLLPVESPEVVPDFVLLAADVMTWLAGLGETDLSRWVVGGTWAEATARMAAVVEAWSRWGPAGDRRWPPSSTLAPGSRWSGTTRSGSSPGPASAPPGRAGRRPSRPVVIDLTGEPEDAAPAPPAPPAPAPEAGSDRQEVAT